MTASPSRLLRTFARRSARPQRASACSRLTFMVALALLTLAPLATARADDPIKGEVKAVNDGGFLRLMFQFDEAVEAATGGFGGIIFINFKQPGARAIVRPLVNAPAYI